jgi:hypothetical protein
VNDDYIMEALTWLLAIFKKKKPMMAAGDWFFH